MSEQKDLKDKDGEDKGLEGEKSSEPKNHPSGGFTKTLDDWRKRQWRRQRGKTSEYIVAIVVNIIFLAFLNALPNLRIPFLTKEFLAVLWIFNLSIVLTILVNAIFLFYNPAWFRALGRIGLNIVGFAVVYILYTVFPFDFSTLGSFAWLQTVVRIALILGMAGIIIGTIIEAINLIYYPQNIR